MATVFQHFSEEKTAFINPGDTTKPVPGFPEVCITTFSEGIIRNYAERNAVSAIAELCTANGSFPVYETCYAGKKIGLFLSRVGAPACTAGLEEVIAMGAKKLVQFGVCGVLNQDAVGGRLILPSSAVRDEGTSYHYLPGAEEIEADPRCLRILKACLEKHGIPYVAGKTWTTDGIYRETAQRIAERKEQGCIAVEMECSASLAVGRFRGIPLMQFLFGADNLDAAQWEPRDLTDYGIHSGDRYLTIALECAAAFSF